QDRRTPASSSRRTFAANVARRLASLTPRKAAPVHISSGTTALVAGALLLTLVTGCSAGPTASEDAVDTPGQAAGQSRGEATFSADGRSFTVELALCSIDETDILLGGHAREV